MGARQPDPPIGTVYGKRTVVGPVERAGRRNAVVLTRCACGYEARVQLGGLLKGRTGACGRCAAATTGHARVEHTGKRFGRWTTVRETAAIVRRTQTGNKVASRQFVCRCDCGTESVIPLGNLLRGMSTGCAPCGYARTAAKNRTHGASGTSGYSSWWSMVRRCHKPSDGAYKNYGARGIYVCAEWRGPGGFERFRDHMGPRPSAEHSVGRIDNDGPYAPGNVRWETPKQQSRNTRRSRLLRVGGDLLTLQEAGDRVGISHEAVRIRRLAGWTDVEAATLPRGQFPARIGQRKGRPRRIFDVNGESLTVKEVAARAGVSIGTVWARVRTGLEGLDLIAGRPVGRPRLSA